jgi:hypothetical protein
VSCRAIRLTFVGELGWELHIPNRSAVAVYQAIMEAGRKLGVANAGYRAIDSLSSEKGTVFLTFSICDSLNTFFYMTILMFRQHWCSLSYAMSQASATGIRT